MRSGQRSHGVMVGSSVALAAESVSGAFPTLDEYHQTLNRTSVTVIDTQDRTAQVRDRRRRWRRRIMTRARAGGVQ